MANAPAIIEHIPAHLVQYRQEGFNERFKVPAGEPIGRISIEGKVFTFIFQEDREIVQTKDGNVLPYMDVCIVDANEKTSKAYWIKGFERGSTDAPDCASILGDKPDPGSPHPQSKTCASCQWDKMRSAENGKGKRCGDSKRLAVLPAWDFDNKDWGGPMLLRIPPTSFKDFGKYWKEQDAQGRDLNLIVTRIRFDPQSPHPKLFFNFQRWITEDEAPLMNEWFESEHIKRVLMVTQAQLTGDPEEEIEEEDDTPASPPRQAAAEGSAAAKVAARRQQAAPTAAPPQRRTAPAPQPMTNGPVRRMPTVQVEEPTVAPPTKRTTQPAATATNVTPIHQPAKGTASPVAPKATAPTKETPEQMRARKKAEFDEIVRRAQELSDELAEDEGEAQPVEGNGVVVDGGYEEDFEQTGDVSTADILAAIDADELSGIPD